MSHEYRNQIDIRNSNKINELLDDMPVFVEDFYNHLIAMDRSTNTIVSYMYEINVFLRFVMVICKKKKLQEVIVTDLDQLSRTNIESYIAKSEDGIQLSANAKRRKLSVLKNFYKYYLSIKAIANNPTLNIAGPKLRAHDVIKLSNSQVKALINCVKTQENTTNHSKVYNERLVPRDLAIIMVLLGTGMRISEMVGLNLSDFDTTDDNKPCFHIVRKGGDEDTVYIPDSVNSAICDYIDFSRPSLNPDSKENALFISTKGTRMSVNAVQKMMKKYCANIGLPDNISPHKLRATFATTVYTQTKDIYAIKDALHHKSIDTSKHYISDKEERMEKAAKAADSLFQ